MKVLTYVAGIITGMVITAVAGWTLMPGMMLVEHKSKYSTVEETCQQLHIAVSKSGWRLPYIRDLNKAMRKQGIHMDRDVKIVELCKGDYAKEILTTNPEVSTFMPCAWGVYEKDDGNVYISAVNMKLMGKMFGGNIERVMGGKVVKDEEKMLEDIIVH